MDKVFAILLTFGIFLGACESSPKGLTGKTLFRVGDQIKVKDGFYQDCYGVLVTRISENEYGAQLACFVPTAGEVAIQGVVFPSEMELKRD